jgi:hypothetical protein
VEVSLIYGESNLIYYEENRDFRIEVERLFNIGVNMGCTSNEERVTLIEKLMDLEAKDKVSVVALGDEGMDQ